ncbi:hypothetical protein QBC40DRAFT_337749 [Triangularia verruculosa]|uniref:Protection of telomeres protein 1 n=1 Tax=Triangularia verruculosa TaxID=2587418 RepID=A0AAN6XM83_9PEZI|nr:hypothetical protein QBC40DRAFT_337749 [Triangularia verruculosa]
MSSPGEGDLPKGFIPLREILDQKYEPGRIVNIMGSVIDCQVPFKTSKDFKATWSLIDRSIEDEPYGIKLNIFRPREADIPEINYQDVVVLRKVKVQRYGANQSLITNHETSIRVYESSKIPKPPKNAHLALRSCPKRDERPELAPEIHLFVSAFYHKLDKSNAPLEDVFREAAQRSSNIRDKFSLLQDVQAEKFYDLIVRVVRRPHLDTYNQLSTVYVSDYTENEAFHDHVLENLAQNEGGDEWGYTSSTQPEPPSEKWIAPEGKKSIQITCWEPHSRVLQDDDVKLGSWIKLKNVQIKYGRDFKHLEGFLREDQKYPDKINIHPLNLEDRENMDDRLKEALRRVKASDKEKRKVIKDIKSAQLAGQKRKASEVQVTEEQPVTNSKQRRRESRALKQKEKEEEAQKARQSSVAAAPIALNTNNEPPPKQNPNQDLIRAGNPHVMCEQIKVAPTTIKTMLQPSYMHVKIGEGTVKVPVPFVNQKYLSFVRVVDFFPSSPEDFAVSRKITQYQDLSDSDDSDQSSSLDEDESSGGDNDPTVKRVWEWRFALLLEDASEEEDSSPAQVWTVIDNNSGQCLTNLDADDLRNNTERLVQLRDTMRILWGNLEDVKKSRTQTSIQRPVSRGSSRPGSRSGGGNNLKMPALDSDEEDQPDVQEKSEPKETVALVNKPFMCCIKQYGVKMGRKDQWMRVFAMDGVCIKNR